MKQLVMEHYRNPQNTADLSHLSQDHQYENPSCGDWIRLEVETVQNRVSGIRFQGEGCSLSISAASMLSSFLSDRSIPEARELAARFIREMTDSETPFDQPAWGDLGCFAEVKDFPIRQRCVVLPFNAFLEECRGR